MVNTLFGIWYDQNIRVSEQSKLSGHKGSTCLHWKLLPRPAVDTQHRMLWFAPDAVVNMHPGHLWLDSLSRTDMLNPFGTPPRIPLQNHTGWPLYKAIFLYRKFFVKFLSQATRSLVYDFVGGTSLATTDSVQGRVTNSVGIHFSGFFKTNP